MLRGSVSWLFDLEMGWDGYLRAQSEEHAVVRDPAWI